MVWPGVKAVRWLWDFLCMCVYVVGAGVWVVVEVQLLTQGSKDTKAGDALRGATARAQRYAPFPVHFNLASHAVLYLRRS